MLPQPVCRNILDLFIVSVCLASLIVNNPILKLLRLVRIFRVARLFRKIRSLNRIMVWLRVARVLLECC